MNINEALMEAAKILKRSQISYPKLESRLLLSYLLSKTQEYIILHTNSLLSQEHLEKFFKLIELRKKYVPIAYLIGYREFYGRNFLVNDSVLIPRSDSEILIDAVVKDYNYCKTKVNILELGVGSGCLIITLLLELKNTIGLGIDIEVDALQVAESNCQKYQLKKSLTLIQSNWFSNLVPDQKYDIIIVNPPYISNCELDKVAQETLLYEPYSALFAENGGLKSYQDIARSASAFLRCNGRLYLELGYSQAEEVGKIFKSSGFTLEQEYYDLAGYCRCFKFKII